MADSPKQDSKISENKVAEREGSEAGSLTDDQVEEVTGGLSDIVITKTTDHRADSSGRRNTVSVG
jgi:hypothetical protein